MTEKEQNESESALRARVGLCFDCAHTDVVDHPRGGEPYRMCGKALDDPAYLKYPPLPVRQCPGYRKA